MVLVSFLISDISVKNSQHLGIVCKGSVKFQIRKKNTLWDCGLALIINQVS